MSKRERELYDQVFGLSIDHNGNEIGTPHTNSILNTLVYEIKCEDGISTAYTEIIIAENIW